MIIHVSQVFFWIHVSYIQQIRYGLLLFSIISNFDIEINFIKHLSRSWGGDHSACSASKINGQTSAYWLTKLVGLVAPRLRYNNDHGHHYGHATIFPCSYYGEHESPWSNHVMAWVSILIMAVNRDHKQADTCTFSTFNTWLTRSHWKFI